MGTYKAKFMKHDINSDDYELVTLETGKSTLAEAFDFAVKHGADPMKNIRLEYGR